MSVHHNIEENKNAEIVLNKQNESYEEKNDIINVNDANEIQINNNLYSAKQLNQDNQIKVVKKERIDKIPATKEGILEWERTNTDYNKYGIAFDIEHCRIYASDSPKMQNLKSKLKAYLEKKEALPRIQKKIEEEKIKERNKESNQAIELIYNEENRTYG